MADTHRYKLVCEVTSASEADLAHWLANHAKGRHSTLQYSNSVNVYLDDDRDWIALREAFDVRKVHFAG